MTTFYLLLSTGAYACLLHCATDYLAAELQSKRDASPTDHDQNKKESDEDCRSGNCNCCYHHGTYVVKEILKSVAHVNLSLTDLGLPLLITEHLLYIPLKTINTVNWPRSTGPPFLSAKPIYLFNRTFLIWFKLMPDPPAVIFIVPFLAWIFTMNPLYISSAAFFRAEKMPAGTVVKLNAGRFMLILLGHKISLIINVSHLMPNLQTLWTWNTILFTPSKNKKAALPR